MMPSLIDMTISGLIFVASMKTYKWKLLYRYILNEKDDFQKLFFYFTDTYQLFSKMQVKFLKSQVKTDFFKIEYGILDSKIVENIRISYFIVKTKNLTRSNF